MTATNHMASGALLAAVIPAPLWVLVPIAVLLHFALDMLPHYGDDDMPKASKTYTKILLVDFILGCLLFTALLILAPTLFLPMLLCALACASPDLMWLPGYLRHVRQRDSLERNKLLRLHAWIQWGERTYGMWYEAAWLLLVSSLLWLVLHP